MIRNFTVGTTFENEECFDLDVLPDGSYASVGTTNFSGGPDRNLWVQRILPTGGALWSVEIGTTGQEGFLNRPNVAALPSGDVVVTAVRNEQSSEADDVRVILFDGNGNLQWEKTLHWMRDRGISVLASAGDWNLGARSVGSVRHRHARRLPARARPVRAGAVVDELRRPGQRLPRGLTVAPGGDLLITGTSDSFAPNGSRAL